jgi:putative oxidoreductase
MTYQTYPRPSIQATPGQAYAMALGRVLLSALFILSGIGKVSAPAATMAYIQSAGLPLPEVSYGMALAAELGCGTLLLVGFFTRPVAALLAVFTLATALVFHHNFADQNQLIHFLKNVSISGGLLYVAVFGAGRLSLDGLRR